MFGWKFDVLIVDLFILSDGSEMNIDEQENNDYITKEIHDLFSFTVIDNPSLSLSMYIFLIINSSSSLERRLI